MNVFQTVSIPVDNLTSQLVERPTFKLLQVYVWITEAITEKKNVNYLLNLYCVIIGWVILCNMCLCFIQRGLKRAMEIRESLTVFFESNNVFHLASTDHYDLDYQQKDFGRFLKDGSV